MTKEEYKKLNDYLNDVTMFLNNHDSFYMNNLQSIAILSDKCLDLLDKYDFNGKIERDFLTFFDVYNMAREVIKVINKDYLDTYDQILDNGILEVNYDRLNDIYEERRTTNNSCCYKKDNIFLDAFFNYEDVCVLVHEFFHILNYNQTYIRYFLTEFISIYFEQYTCDVLIGKSIDTDKIRLESRTILLNKYANFINKYNKFLLSFDKFGNIDDNTYELLNKYICHMSKENYEKELKQLYDMFKDIHIKYCFNTSTENYSESKLTEELAYPFTQNYRYFLATLLTFYTIRYCKRDDILKLNELISDENNNYDIFEALKMIDININAQDFNDKLISSLEYFIKEYLIQNGKAYEKNLESDVRKLM